MSRADHTIEAAFLPLTDCAPLVVAHELGFAQREGLTINLARETSWATIRDRLAVAHIDVAHALAPMPIASNLGLCPISKSLIAPMALGFGGNTVTVSTSFWAEIQSAAVTPGFDAQAALRAMADVVVARRSRRPDRLRFGIVHPHSAHRYELAYWLASGGIMPGRDVEFVVLPPSLMGTALANGGIDGFCAGEPWGSIAVAGGAGQILTTKAHIWRSSPEKVLAVGAGWAEDDEARLGALIRAIYNASAWCDDPANRRPLAELLADKAYLDQPAQSILPGLERSLVDAGGQVHQIDGFLNFCSRAATFPWISHALWLYSQMVRWGDVAASPESEAIVTSTYRPDLYRKALAPQGVAMPAANSKIEGALMHEVHVGSVAGELTLGPDGFFDGMAFDPDMTGSYIEMLTARDRRSLSGSSGDA